MKKFWKFIKDEDGIELAEYAVMGALVIVIVAAVATTLGDTIVDVFNEIITSLGGGEG